MYRSNEVTLGEAIDTMLKDLKLTHGVHEAQIQAMWEGLMGRVIARHTILIQLKGSRLCLTIDSAPLKNELFFSREKIKETVNRALKEDVLKDVFIY
jgi:hypothetical protein